MGKHRQRVDNGTPRRRRGGAVHAMLVLAAVFLQGYGAFAQQPPSGSLFLYPETALSGTVTAQFEDTAGKCQKICDERSGCAGFDRLSTANVCRIYSGITSASSDPRSTAGARNLVQGYRDPVNPPLAPPPSVPLWYFAQFNGVDFYGGDIIPKGYESYSLNECSQRCDTNPSCRAFTFNQAQNRCFLKSGYDFVQRVGGGTAGLYFKGTSPESIQNLTAEWDVYINGDLPGNDLYEYPAATYQICMAACKSNDSCGGFTWVYRTKKDHCYLKYISATTNVVGNKNGVVSARRISQPIVPDFVRPVPPRD